VAGARRIVEVNGVDLQRMANVDLGTRRAAQFAREFPTDPTVGRTVYNIMLKNLRENTPVLNQKNSPTAPHKPGELRDSIKGFKIGGRIQWYWLAYGAMLVRGTPAHDIYPRAGRSIARGKKALAVNSMLARSKIVGLLNYRALKATLRFLPRDGVAYINRDVVHHPGIQAHNFVQHAIYLSIFDYNDMMEQYGRRTIAYIRDAVGFSEIGFED